MNNNHQSLFIVRLNDLMGCKELELLSTYRESLTACVSKFIVAKGCVEKAVYIFYEDLYV